MWYPAPMSTFHAGGSSGHTLPPHPVPFPLPLRRRRSRPPTGYVAGWDGDGGPSSRFGGVAPRDVAGQRALPLLNRVGLDKAAWLVAMPPTNGSGRHKVVVTAMVFYSFFPSVIPFPPRMVASAGKAWAALGPGMMDLMPWWLDLVPLGLEAALVVSAMLGATALAYPGFLSSWPDPGSIGLGTSSDGCTLAPDNGLRWSCVPGPETFLARGSVTHVER